MTHVVVAGAGLAGLVAARRLAAAGLEVTVLEENDEVGGRVRSVQEDGYTFDRGFQVLFTAYPAVRRELDLAALDLEAFRPGATLARPGSRSAVADPLGDPGGLTASLFSTELTAGDKLRLLRLWLDLRRSGYGELLAGPDTSIEGYLRERGFSTAFLENVIAPFYGGITLDRSLSTSAAVFRYTFKALAAGRTALPAAGMGAVPAQLAARVREAGATIDLDRPVAAVSAEAGGVSVETERETLAAAACVVATDPPTARELTGVEAVPTAGRGCVTQYFSLPATQRLGVRHPLVLNAGGTRPNQVALLTDVAEGYAPEGRQLLAATHLGVPEADDGALAARVADSLRAWFPENRFGELELRRTVRVPFAQFDQPPGFRDRVPAPTAPEGPVVLAGDYTRWSSIQGALESGRRAARAVSARR